MKIGWSSAVTFGTVLVLLGLHGPRTHAQEKQDDRQRSPRATVRTLLTSITVARANPQLIENAVSCLDLSDLPSAAREEVGRRLANKLKQIIVRHPRVILQEIPDSNYSDPYVLLSSPQGIIELVRIPSGNRKGEWVFSRDTVNSIDKLYVAVEDRPYDEAIVASGTLAYFPGPWGETEMWLRSQLPGWLRATVLSTPRFSLQVYEILDVLRLAEELNVELAYPTQTIHLVPTADLVSQPGSLLSGGLQEAETARISGGSCRD